MRSHDDSVPVPCPARRPRGRSRLAAWLISPVLGVILAGCATAPTAEELAVLEEDSPAKRTENKIRDALMGKHRSKKDKDRGPHRHPLITLTFFGLEDSMNVIELQPGWGWYTDVLAPVLRERGKLTVTVPDPGGDPESYGLRQARALDEKKARHPEIFDKVETVVVEPPGKLTLGPPGSADMVLGLRCLHTWMEGGYAEAMLAEIFKVLRAGGTFGVEGHRADPGKTDPRTGYVAEDDAIKLIEKAGFKLDAKSNANANPRDTKDHPEGVWTLPPTLALGDTDRDKYLAIGESDRFTLRFKKP